MKRVNGCLSDMESWTELSHDDDPVDHMEPVEAPAGVDASLLTEFSNRLTTVWEYLARGKTADSRAHRVWAVLYVLRHDLLDREQVKDYAKRKGISAQAIERYVTEFRRVILAREGKESLNGRPGEPGSEIRRVSTRK